MHLNPTPPTLCTICGCRKTNPERFYCSRTCSNKSRAAARVDRTCEVCGAGFSVLASKLNWATARYCSKPCKWADQPKPVQRTCLTCGKQFVKRPCEVGSDLKPGNYCSHKCRPVRPATEADRQRARVMGLANVGERRGADHPRWRGGPGRKPYYGPNWYSQARATRERDRHTCQDCGNIRQKGQKQFDVHHKVPLRKFHSDYDLANDLGNLITLCFPCHRRWEEALHALYAPWD